MKNYSRLFSVLFAASSLAACGGSQTTSLTAAEGAPASQGTAKASLDDNGNTVLAVEVKHLAPPDRISKGAAFYVVWAKPTDGGPVQNLGMLQVNEDRKGDLKTKTPLRDFTVLVTPESSGSVSSPSSASVMSSEVHIK